jgi:hypothetical protein
MSPASQAGVAPAKFIFVEEPAETVAAVHA